jgi:hypothetical protein
MLATRSPIRRRPVPTRRLTMRGERPATPRREDLRHKAAERKRIYRDLRSVANAVKHLGTLPRPGCTIHAVTGGNYHYSDLIPAVLQLAAPAKLAYIAITTLGFSVRASRLLIKLLDAGDVARVDFICADFFEKADSDVCRQLRADLTARGSRFASARCHAKLMLLETTDRRYYISESSANIRACNSLEQFCLTQDRQLFDFHRAWICELIDAYDQARQAREGRRS